MTATSPQRARAGRFEEVTRDVERLPFKSLGKQLYYQFKRDRVTSLAAQVAYHLIFAIPPLILFTITIAALVDHFTGAPITQNLHTAITQHAPADTQALLDSLVNHAIAQTTGGAATVGAVITILLALWGGSGGIGSLITAFNMAYEVDEGRPFLLTYLVKIGLTILLIVLIIVAFVLFVFGREIGVFIANQVGLGSVFNVAWNILRWPAAVLMILFLLWVLYFIGPNVDKSPRWAVPGAVVATVGWFLAVIGFDIYLKVSNPGSAYGAAGSILVLLFFLYVTGIVFILGAEVNAVLEHRYDPETLAYLKAHPDAIPSDVEKQVIATRESRAEANAEQGRSVAGVHQTLPRAASDESQETRTRNRRPGLKLIAPAAASFILGTVIGRMSRRRPARRRPGRA